MAFSPAIWSKSYLTPFEGIDTFTFNSSSSKYESFNFGTIIDFGTATTYDVVTAKGEFIGGATAPGLGISANALSSQAAKLPEVEIQKPEKIIAKNTIKSMQAGTVYGYIGQTEYIIKKIKEEYGQNLKVISTGGLGRVISNETDEIDIYDADLTFKGLKLIYDRNKKKEN